MQSNAPTKLRIIFGISSLPPVFFEVEESRLLRNGVLRVEKYDDCFVLTNPGLLKLPIDQIYKGGESKARNQRMQNMFRMIGYGENLGSGFPLILNAWNEKHWVRPELLEQPELMQVKLTLHIQNEPATEPVNESVNEPVNEPVSKRQQAVLSAMKQNLSIAREILASKLNVSLATLKRELSSLRQKGYITRSGSDKNGQWVILKNN